MKRLLSFLIILFLLCGEVQTAFAVPPEVISKSKNFRFVSDMNLRGVYGSDSFYFYVDDYWKVQAASFTLFISQSQLIDEKYSTLTVLLNNKPVYSLELGGSKEYKNNVEISLPVEEITAKYNEIRIQLYRRISDKPCTDDLNPANWLTVHSESFVHLNFNERSSSGSLGEFPYPFMKASDELPMKSIITVPDNFTDGEASAAVTLSAGLGLMKRFENLSVRLLKISEAQKDLDIIYIGKTASTPPEILELFNEEERNRSENTSILKRTASPYNNSKELLAIISNNEEALMNASRLLSDSELIKQAKGNTMALDSINKKLPNKVDGEINLEELGYSGINLEGPFRQQSSFAVSIPKNRLIREGSKLILNFRYSRNLDFDRALVTVYINDIPLGSKKLSEAQAENDTLEVQLPDDIRKAVTYDVRVAFDLEVEGLDCVIRQENNPWAYILNSSHLSLSYEDGREVLFENYSNPFVKDGVLSNTAIIIPDDSGSEELSMASNLAAFIGHDITSNTGSIEIVRAGSYSMDKQNKNLIVIGTPTNNSIIKDLNNSFYIKYGENFTGLTSNEKIDFLEDYSRSLTALELIKSPYKEEATILVITSPEMKNIIKAQKYLTDFEFKNRLIGNAAIIDEEGNSKSFYFGEDNKTPEANRLFKKITLNEQTKLFITFLGFLILFIIIFIVLFMRKRRRNR